MEETLAELSHSIDLDMRCICDMGGRRGGEYRRFHSRKLSTLIENEAKIFCGASVCGSFRFSRAFGHNLEFASRVKEKIASPQTSHKRRRRRIWRMRMAPMSAIKHQSKANIADLPSRGEVELPRRLPDMEAFARLI
eukprot:scaffold16942_cov118-Isochrysis_galbana.AAC.3